MWGQTEFVRTRRLTRLSSFGARLSPVGVRTNRTHEVPKTWDALKLQAEIRKAPMLSQKSQCSALLSQKSQHTPFDYIFFEDVAKWGRAASCATLYRDRSLSPIMFRMVVHFCIWLYCSLLATYMGKISELIFHMLFLHLHYFTFGSTVLIIFSVAC